MDVTNAKIGIIGLGKMGGGIARNVMAAGFELTCFDKDDEVMTAVADAGAMEASSIDDVLDRCDIVMTCVLGRHSMPLYEENLISKSRSGQIFIDHATIPVPAAKRIGAALRNRDVEYIEAPISGGQSGAHAGTLRMFLGGSKNLIDACMPLFEAAANPEKIVYCGEVGMGQAAKVVQQLTSRLPDLARLEVVQFGLKSGLSLDLIKKALNVDDDSKDPYVRICDAVERDDICQASYEFSEWEFYLEQAKNQNFAMPIIKTLFDLVKGGDYKVLDGAGRPEPSVWDELMK